VGVLKLLALVGVLKTVTVARILKIVDNSDIGCIKKKTNRG